MELTRTNSPKELAAYARRPRPSPPPWRKPGLDSEPERMDWDTINSHVIRSYKHAHRQASAAGADHGPLGLLQPFNPLSELVDQRGQLVPPLVFGHVAVLEAIADRWHAEIAHRSTHNR